MPIKQRQIPPVPSEHDATFQRHKFQEVWAQERAKGSPSLLRAFVIAFQDRLRTTIGLELLDLFLSFFIPLLNQAIMEFQMSMTRTITEGLFYVTLSFLIRIGMAILGTQSGRVEAGISLDVHSCLMSATYEEALKMKGASYSKGDIMSIQSMDSSAVASFLLSINSLWTTPAQILISLTLLLSVIGPSALIGIAVMLLIFPLESLVFWAMASLRIELLYYNDQRLSYMNEMLSGIKVVKFQSMESYFMGRITDVRRRELVLMKRQAYWSSMISVIFQLFPIVYSTLTYLAFASLGNVLTPAIIFTTSSLFGNLRGPLSRLPKLVSSLASAQASIKRIERLLLVAAESPRPRTRETGMLAGGSLAVEISESNFAWGENLPDCLHKIRLEIPVGSMVGVYGRVGSGKSSLLAAICGELIARQPDAVKVSGTISYAPQTPFILGNTFAANVKFFRPTEWEKYEEIIRCAQLRPDIIAIGASGEGDQAIIAEGGANLSGGQRQRLNIARAAYYDGDIFLLDDPLSAVDAKVARKLMSEMFLGFLERKTRILVTHQLQYLPLFDKIIVMDGGNIQFDGPPWQLVTDPEFQSKCPEMYRELARYGQAQLRDVTGLRTRFRLSTEVEPWIDTIKQPLKRAVVPPKPADEERQEGPVRAELFFWYLSHCGRVLFFYVIFLVSAQFMSLQGDLFNSYFADRKFVLKDGTDPGILFYIGLQFATGFIGSLSNLLDGLAKVEAGMEAAWRLHNRMLASILRAPMAFFDLVPTGRILSRFSSDLDQLDSGVADQLAGVVSLIFTGISTVAVLIVMMPSLLLAFLPLTSVYYALMVSYRATSREINRIMASASAPMYSHVAETLNGISTIRVYNAVETVVKQHDEKINEYNAVYWCSSNIGRWLSIRLDFLGAIIAFISSMIVILDPSLPPGVAGLLMSYSASITGILESSVTVMSELENEMNSVSRVRYYTENIPKEAPLKCEPRPPLDWMGRPADFRSGLKGSSIEVDNLGVSYTGDKMVLQNVSFRIRPGERVGIVGRTGSGKSTLLQCLLRMMEPREGRIIIDGHDITTVGLQDLRSRIAIIPQEPVLFSGSLRMNLDPSSQHPDSTVMDAIDAAGCRQFVDMLPGKLYAEVVEGGRNFSIGERQQLCLARALLRQNSVLLMDEATANVDAETDAKIQATVRTYFRGCTVISVAHRLDTVIGYDKILVLENGRVADFDTPAALFYKEGLFRRMCQDSGQMEELERMLPRAEVSET